MYEYKFDCTKVIDGDKLDGEIDLGFHQKWRRRVRLIGVSSPNIRSNDEAEKAAGYKVRKSVMDLIHSAHLVTIKTVKDLSGRYSSILGTVYVDGENLNEKVLMMPGVKNYKRRSFKESVDKIAEVKDNLEEQRRSFKESVDKRAEVKANLEEHNAKPMSVEEPINNPVLNIDALQRLKQAALAGIQAGIHDENILTLDENSIARSEDKPDTVDASDKVSVKEPVYKGGLKNGDLLLKNFHSKE